MKSIKTLIADIQSRLTSGEPFDTETVKSFGVNLANKLANRLSEERGKPSLRMSNLGTQCDRKLWYSIIQPEKAEALSPSARLKFLLGDIVEEVMLFLAKAAGHTVQDEQAKVDLHGVIGHIDGTVDGELVDVKSASSYGFRKFRDHGLEQDDPFGYLDQLGGYLEAGASLPSLVEKSKAHFLAVEKQMGYLALDTYERSGTDYEALVAQKREILASETPPDRGYGDEADGASGNRKLGIACSYCSFKTTCWPGLRAFNYSGRPRFLSVVEREPNVPEMKLNEVEQ